MRLASIGYCPQSSINILERDWQLFCNHFDLLLESEQIIFNSADYFFCCPSFASCSWPYIQRDGDLFLGYLLLGWHYDVLIEQCPSCISKVLITSFAGSLLSGGNTWTGLCKNCRQINRGQQSSKFRQWVDFVLALRQKYPAAVEVQEEYEAQQFSWGGTGLVPAIKRRTVQVSISQPVDLGTLILELSLGTMRQPKAVNISLLKNNFRLKLFSQV